jgi:hypothetical protein
MGGYLITQGDGAFADAIIRAEHDDKARVFARNGETLHVIRRDVAEAMLVPAAEGRHEGALRRWLRTPSNILGDPLNKEG